MLQITVIPSIALNLIIQYSLFVCGSTARSTDSFFRICNLDQRQVAVNPNKLTNSLDQTKSKQYLIRYCFLVHELMVPWAFAHSPAPLAMCLTRQAAYRIPAV